jgi:hypothetical protein
MAGYIMHGAKWMHIKLSCEMGRARQVKGANLSERAKGVLLAARKIRRVSHRRVMNMDARQRLLLTLQKLFALEQQSDTQQKRATQRARLRG